ncbi:MAG: HEAT repeat domain-containing protein [candidate division Zixibacteria bacterium]|nr:HEAT repeat domain-containing protein [candidate division Zixibacteria bacterium]
MLFDFSLLKREDLELDLRELGREILRELFLSSRRLTLYTREHPAEKDLSKKPFNWMKKLFRVRSYFDFHLYQEKLYAMGIPLKEEVFIRGLKAELSKFELGSVYIYSQATADELNLFLRRLSEKLLPLPKNLNLQRFLEEKRINSIRVKNSEPGDTFLEESISLAEKCDDFKVKTFARISLQQNPQLMLDILSRKIRKDINLEGKLKFDFRLKVFQSMLLEEFSKLPGEKVKELLRNEFAGKDWDVISLDVEYLDGVKNLVKAFIHHPERDYLFSELKNVFVHQGAPENFFEKALDESTLLKIKTLRDSELVLDKLISGEAKAEEEESLKNLLIKLINLNQVERLKKTIDALWQNLFSEKENLRQISFFWLKSFSSLFLKYSQELFQYFVQEMLSYKDRTDFQYFQLLENCAGQSIISREYGQFNKIIQELRSDPGKEYSPEKEERYLKIIQGFARDQIIQQLVEEIKSRRKEAWEKVGDALILIGGEKIAQALEPLLTDPDRTIRQVVLKIAGSGLGEAGADYFSRTIQDDSNFQRDSSGNLTLDSWFKIRNILHILSDIKSEKSLTGLEKWIHDKDLKVKKAVLQTLEKTGGKKSEELILALAQEEDKEIRKLALMALGSCGSESSVDKLKELFYKDEDNAILILHTINNIGGEKGFKFLIEVINQPRIFEKWISGKKIDEEIKLEAVRALKKKDSDSSKEMDKLRGRYDRIKFLADKIGQLSKS